VPFRLARLVVGVALVSWSPSGLLAAQDTTHARTDTVGHFHIGLTIHDYGFSFGNAARINGVRLNVQDADLERVNGINVTLWKPREPLTGTVNGVQIGLLPGSSEVNGVGVGLAGLVADGSIHGIGFGGLGAVANGDLKGVRKTTRHRSRSFPCSTSIFKCKGARTSVLAPASCSPLCVCASSCRLFYCLAASNLLPISGQLTTFHHAAM